MFRHVVAVSALSVIGATVSLSQETPTQRDAAKEVVQKQAELERSLGVGGLVAKLTGANAARDAVAARG
jgi:hypothetical protein